MLKHRIYNIWLTICTCRLPCKMVNLSNKIVDIFREKKKKCYVDNNIQTINS